MPILKTISIVERKERIGLPPYPNASHLFIENPLCACSQPLILQSNPFSLLQPPGHCLYSGCSSHGDGDRTGPRLVYGKDYETHVRYGTLNHMFVVLTTGNGIRWRLSVKVLQDKRPERRGGPEEAGGGRNSTEKV